MKHLSVCERLTNESKECTCQAFLMTPKDARALYRAVQSDWMDKDTMQLIVRIGKWLDELDQRST